MAEWLEHTVQIEVDAPIELVWSLWSDLTQMPRWMKWIEGVVIEPDDPSVSIWKLGSNGLVFNWKARIVKQTPKQIIQWESIDGLPNRGAIRFYDRGEAGSIVKMTIAYAIPQIVSQIMNGLSLGKVVESTLYADLERFRDYAIKAQDQSIE
ncbi:SRPBCC family protein [filamentous cyanobacterium LEGE 11480]|uniref:SRPBCC family protein n=1 Tax=Romeriopsis navalis LEGE 11480 TaxID=2777977 RepID=A0A928Z1D6_9CYAN|nr:SRPBCC family protein [Romeriopsis navalis]MBE9028399.1 SRPBCC family protein [Romeriopsis navalis LEGE 11480]